MIQEDDPGWDCATMGNLICGPDSVSPTMGYHDVMTYYGMPDTAMQEPTDGGLTGVIMILILFGLFVIEKVRGER